MNNEDYAIVIGVSAYSSLPILSGATKDATEFAQWLEDPNGGALPSDNIKLILSPEIPRSNEEPRPHQRQIDEALKGFRILNLQGRIGRRLYFYFSGHGYGRDGDIGMFMADASRDQSNYNIGLTSYKTFMSRWGFWDEVVFILDCCRSPIYSATFQGPSFTMNPPYPTPEPIVDDFFAFATLSGTASFSVWDPSYERKRGILTTAILEGLRNKAVDGNGRITCSSLSKYVKDRVPVIAKANQVEQAAQSYFTVDEIIFKEDISIMKPVGVSVSLVINQLIIWSGDFKRIGEYKCDANNQWAFNYLTQDAELMKIVQSSHQFDQVGNETTIWVELRQGGVYGLQTPPEDIVPLDLRKEQELAGEMIILSNSIKVQL